MGDWGKTIALLAVVASVLITGSQFPNTTAQKTPGSACVVPDDATEVALCVQPTESINTARLRIAPGTSLLLGSLDQTATQHQIRITWHADRSDDSESNHQLASSHSVLSFPTDWELPVEVSMPQPGVRGPQFAKLTNSENQPASNGLHASVAARPMEAVVAQHTLTEKRTSRFVVPYFSGQLVHDRHVLAREVARGDRVSVYLVEGDQAAFHQDESQAMDIAVEVAVDIIRRTESRVLDFVQTQLGPIDDLNNDGRLSFVLGRLSDHRSKNSMQQPITGCVRPDDFLPELQTADSPNPGGDIVYLDCTLPAGKELDAVLAHELTHAATFCVINTLANPRSNQLPGWLNEAVAHYIEHQINPQSENLKDRLADFTRHPNRFPLVIPDNVHQLSLRRGPTRAAACLFLSSTLEQLPPETLRSLVCCPKSGTERLESVTGESFSGLLRSWGLNLMASSRDFPRHVLNDRQSRLLNLAGTAFTWTAPATESGTFEIEATPESLLQVTIIKPRRSRMATADSKTQRQ